MTESKTKIPPLLAPPHDEWMVVPEKNRHEQLASRDIWPAVTAAIDFFLAHAPDEFEEGWDKTVEYSDAMILRMLRYTDHFYEDLDVVEELIYQPLKSPVISGLYEYSAHAPITHWQSLYLPVNGRGRVYYREAQIHLSPHPENKTGICITLSRGDIIETNGIAVRAVKRDHTHLTLRYVPGETHGEYLYHDYFSKPDGTFTQLTGEPVELNPSMPIAKIVRSAMVGGQFYPGGMTVFGDPAAK